MIEFSTTITHVKDQPSATPPYPGIVPIYGYPIYSSSDLCIQRERLAVFHGVVVFLLAGPEVSGRRTRGGWAEQWEAGFFLGVSQGTNIPDHVSASAPSGYPVIEPGHVYS